MTTLPMQLQAAPDLALPEAVTLLTEQADVLQTAVHAALRQNLFNNHGRLMTPRILPEVSQIVVQGYLQSLRFADLAPLTEQVEMLVSQGLGHLAALAVSDALYKTSLALLPDTLPEATHQALSQCHHHFLFQYMGLRERATIIARENLYQNVQLALEKQMEQERVLRRELLARSNQLARERGLLTSLLDSIPDLIFYKDVAGAYLGCNDAFAEFADRTEADLVGKTDFDLFPHEVAAAFREQDSQMMAQGQSRHNEEWVDYPDGRRVLLDTLKTPFYDTDKNLMGLIGISRDITSIYQSQAEVLRLSYVVQQSLDGTAVADLNGIIQFANPAWATMHGYEVAELIGQHLSIFHTPEQLANEVEPVNQQAIISGQTQRAEISHVRRDGSTFLTLMTIGLLKGSDDTPIGLVAAIQDITEQKATAAALRENEARLAEATRIAKLHSWEFDVDTGLFTFRPEYYELLGTTVEEEGGLTMTAADYARKYVPAAEAEIVGRENAAVLATTDPNYYREFDSFNVTKDGRVIPIRVRFRVVKDQEGRTIKTIGANQDITEQVKAEQALRENEARLLEASKIARLHSWEFDVDTGLFTFRPEYYELLGTTVEEEGGLTMTAADYARKYVPAAEAEIVGRENAAVLDPPTRITTASLIRLMSPKTAVSSPFVCASASLRTRKAAQSKPSALTRTLPNR
ncbi:MAG: PAS domain S-box protein [Chloroflexi bacterium]|nr:PAS domain S-box protein [Chloroflexota bacterium]